MIGVNIVGGNVNPRALDSLYEMGNRAVRYWIDGSKVIRAHDDYDLTQVITDLERIRNSGHYAYANWGSVPAWMSEGKPTYLPFGCWVPWKTGDPEKRDGTPAELAAGGGWRFARPSEKPYCFPPNCPAIDSAEVEAWTYALASECSDLIDWFGQFNETDQGDFWPPISELPYSKGHRQLVEQVLIPGARGYRRGATGGVAMIVGPECATAGGLMELLKIEREMGARLFDVLSGHLYSWTDTYPGNVYERAADFLTHVDDRAFWNTESDAKNGGMTGDWVAAYVEMRRRFGDRIRAHFRYAPWAYFEGGEAAWKRGEFVTNSQWRGMRAVLKDEELTRGKRRSVR